MSGFGPQGIQGLTVAKPLHPVLQYGVLYRQPEYPVPCPSMAQSLLVCSSVFRVMSSSLCLRSTAFRWIQAGFNKMAPDVTPGMQYFALFTTFSRRESSSNRRTVLSEEGSSWTPPAPDWNLCDCSFLGCLKSRPTALFWDYLLPERTILIRDVLFSVVRLS
jgi:hypothetical protein